MALGLLEKVWRPHQPLPTLQVSSKLMTTLMMFVEHMCM